MFSIHAPSHLTIAETGLKLLLPTHSGMEGI